MLRAGLHECLGEGPGDWPCTLGFALSAAKRSGDAANLRSSSAERGSANKPLFILRLKAGLQEFGGLYGHGLAAFGLDAASAIAVTAASEKDLLWAAEEIAQSQAARAVIAALEPQEKLYGFPASLRLKLRAGKTPVFLLRHWRQEGATAAHSRWRLARRPSPPEALAPGFMLPGPPRLCARLERGQGLPLSSWEMEYHAPDGFGLAALLADGAHRAGLPQRAAC